MKNGSYLSWNVCLPPSLKLTSRVDSTVVTAIFSGASSDGAAMDVKAARREIAPRPGAARGGPCAVGAGPAAGQQRGRAHGAQRGSMGAPPSIFSTRRRLLIVGSCMPVFPPDRVVAWV